MAAKFRQPGCVCVTPTPSMHACADAARSGRRVVDPRNTILTVGVVDEGCMEDFEQPLPHAAISIAHPMNHLLRLAICIIRSAHRWHPHIGGVRF
jgi:hypothetical protein